MDQPIAIDLYCGLGGWTEGLLEEGYYVVGFDIERHQYGEERYPGHLVLQDVLTLHGRQFRHASLIVGSSPCQEFSYRAMPWKRAKSLGPPVLGMELFEAQFRIQREASEAAGRHIPMVVENVRGAQKWVGRSRWNFGSFHLWGDVPALMPMPVGRGVKVAGISWSGSDKPGYVAKAFNGTAEQRLRDDVKNTGGSWFNVAHNTTSGKGQNPDGRLDGVKHHGSGAIWFDTGPASKSSKSQARKRASAMIAKIPLALSRHIARTYFPTTHNYGNKS